MYAQPQQPYSSQHDIEPATVKPLRPDLMDLKTWMANHRRLFPALFTLCTFAIFGSPVMAGIELANNPTVTYWIGWGAWFVLSVPILLVVAHIAQMLTNKPTFWAMLLSTVVPSIILMIVGYTHQAGASNVAEKLRSSDCLTFTPKALLQESYVEAESAFRNCTAQLAVATNQDVAVVEQGMILQDCPAFNDGSYTKQWHYIAEMEQNQACSGWCEQGVPSLFTKPHLAKDPCTLVAGVVLNTQVSYIAERMFMVGLIDLIISIFALAIMQEFVVKADIEW